MKLGTALLCAALLAPLLAAGCTQPAAGTLATLTLAADAKTAPADGLATIHLTATIANAPANAVITFEVQGVGLLSATNALTVNNKAEAELYAPLESELVGGQSAATVIAHYAPTATTNIESPPVKVQFTIPTQGAPQITAYAQGDRVLAGGTTPITLVVDAVRLAAPSVTLAADAGSPVTVPATLALTDDGSGLLHGELAVNPPANPANVVVHVSADGAQGVDVTLHFIAEGAAAFDLSGDFAQVSFGIMEIGGLGPVLDPATQCVVSPTFSLVHIEQTGSQLTVTSTTCDMQMGTINVGFGVGKSTNAPSPGFVGAINKHNAPLSWTLANVGPNAPYKPPFSAYGTPAVLGATLGNPHDDLPTSESDPRVVDDDGDGFPGVTITNSSQGAQHVVSRTSIQEINGTIDSSDSIHGSVTATGDSSILNGSTPMSPTMTTFPSPFFDERVDGQNGTPNIGARDGDASSISCADVVAYESELLALHATPDQTTACQQ